MSALFDDDMSDISSFNDDESDSADSDAGPQAAASHAAADTTAGAKPSEPVGVALDGDSPAAALSGFALPDPGPRLSPELERAHRATEAFKQLLPLRLPQPAVVPRGHHSVHLAQTADSVEAVHSMFRVVAAASSPPSALAGSAAAHAVAQAFFTCATYQQQGVDTGQSSVGLTVADAADDTTNTTANGGTSATADAASSRKCGQVFFFCLEEERPVGGGDGGGGGGGGGDGDASSSAGRTQLYLLDVVDPGSAVFDVAWLCDGAWAAQPVAAVACADSAVRVYAPRRVGTGAAEDAAAARQAAVGVAGGGGVDGAGAAAAMLEGVRLNRFRCEWRLQLQETVHLPSLAAAAPASPPPSPTTFDNRLVRVLSVRWDHDRQEQGSVGSGRAGKIMTEGATTRTGGDATVLRRRLLSTHSDGTAAMWECRRTGAAASGSDDDGLGGVGTCGGASQDGVHLALQGTWVAHEYFGAPSEVWTACFARRTADVVFTGADDGRLKMWRWRRRHADRSVDSSCSNGGDDGDDDDDGNDAAATLMQEHRRGPDGHGVTVLRAHPSGLLAAGSYDGSITIWNPLEIRAGPLRVVVGVPATAPAAAEPDGGSCGASGGCSGGGAADEAAAIGGGGVWRLRWHPGLQDRNLLLAACMRGGARVLDFSRAFPFAADSGGGAPHASVDTGAAGSEVDGSGDGPAVQGESVSVVMCRSHVPGSIVYGADWLMPDRRLAGTCSFYDRHLTVWDASAAGVAGGGGFDGNTR